MTPNLNHSINTGLSRLAGLQEASEGNAALLDALRPRFDKLRTRHQDGTAPKAISAFNLFQTPEPLAKELVKMAEIGAQDRVLEPSAGLGRLLQEARAEVISAEYVAIEQSPECVSELESMFPDTVTHQRDFLEVTPEEIGVFDRVIMNPPFKMRRDIKHIKHAVKFVRPGGRLVSLCLAGEIREKALQHLCDDWREIPARTFGKEGTRVATILLSITK